MKRVHRDLSRDEVEALRQRLTSLVPNAQAGIPDILRTMRLIVRKSQAEYAALCGVSQKALADIEVGRGASTTTTLEKLLRPFGLTLGVVMAESAPSSAVAGMNADTAKPQMEAARTAAD